jgi:protein involved in polysaccharide export with SLBB domain
MTLKLKGSKIALLLIIFTLSVVPYSIIAQTSALSGTDLSNINVDELTDDQLQQFLERANTSGYTQQQIEAAALAKGLPQSELLKLQQRLNSIETLGTNRGKPITADRNRRLNNKDNYPARNDLNSLFGSSETNQYKNDTRSKIFGYSLFNTRNLTFEPSVNIPTPADYQLGPGDELIIDIWGASQQNYRLTVSPDGYIVVDNIGPILVNGLTIENVSSRLISKLASIYAGLKGPNPTTFAQISLGNLRSIKVILLGEVNLPGSYTLSSLSSAFNALYLSGGPNINGSLRDIEIVRNNKNIENIDVYDFLLKGDKSHDIRLNDMDIIRISPYLTRVKISGEVKRPSIYEITKSENLSDLISFAGGFTDRAYSQRLKIYRNTSREKQLLDVKINEFKQFALQNGDSIVVEPILKRFENRVEIRGALYRPGEYSLDEGLTIKKLIEKAEGLRGDAFMSRTVIYRTKEDLTTEAIAVDLSSLLNGSTEDIQLKREDVIVIPSILDLQEEYFVQIDGEVRQPGQFPFVYNTTLQNVILMAGGFLESASTARIEIARRVKDNSALSSSLKVADIYYFQINKDLRLSDSASNFKLEPFDWIFIRHSPGYVKQANVRVEGEVIFPGDFSIANKVEKISDLLKRSGGLTGEAFPKGAHLVRTTLIDEKERIRTLQNLKLQSKDSLTINPAALDKEQTIGIELVKILAQPGSKYDLILQEGDVIVIPKQLQTVRLTGALLRPSIVRFDSQFGFMNYIDNSGGFADEARKSKSYVLYANGSIRRTHNFFGIRSFPRIEPGAEIIVPKKNERKKMSTIEVVSFGSAFASFALILITIIQKL